MGRKRKKTEQTERIEHKEKMQPSGGTPKKAVTPGGKPAGRTLDHALADNQVLALLQPLCWRCSASSRWFITIIIMTSWSLSASAMW